MMPARLAQTYLPPLHTMIRSWIDGGLLDAIEICPDRYFTDPLGVRYLAALTEELSVPYSFHLTGMSLGSPDFLARYDLSATARTLAGFSPLLVSDHLSASAVGSFRYDGNLPCVHDEVAVEYVSDHVRRIREAFAGNTFLVENVPCQFEYAASTMSPESFTIAVVERAGCGLLLDLHNLYVHERNHGLDAEGFLAEIPPEKVLELHLAGGRTFARSGEYLDGHCSAVPDRVIELLRVAIRRFSPLLVVVEREQDFDDHEGMRRDLERIREVMG